MGKNWRIKSGEMWVRDDRGTWLADRFAMMFEPELYSRRLLELV